MAQLDSALRTQALAPPRWTSAQTREQFRSVAWLRWRITVNQFRKKGGVGELIGSIVIWLIFASFAIGMMFLAAASAGFLVHKGRASSIDLVLWSAFFITQFVNIQIGQPGTVFDPTQLIRFPMSAKSYIFLRLFFGLLTPGNVLIALLSLSAAVGITIADSSLWFFAFSGMIVFAITNALFSRMIFAWVDRWLSTRRAREVFTTLIILFSLGIQYANVHFNPAFNHQHHNHGDVTESSQPPKSLDHMRVLYHSAQPYTRPLPPSLIATSIVDAQEHQPGAGALQLLGCLAFAALFYGIFAWRTATEFRGENLTDVANGVSKSKPSARTAATITPTAAFITPATRTQSTRSQTVSAVLEKEILQIRRNVGLLFGLIAPVFFVFLFAGKISSRGNSPWIFPLALVYVMLGIAPITFNSFGLEAEGAQFYFMAPASMRHILLAKNLISYAMAALDVAITMVVIFYVAVLPPAPIVIASLLWVAATLFVETMIGNRRSITTPKKIESGRMAGKQASQVSALLSFGILLGSAAIAGSLLMLTMYFGHAWLLVPVFAILAAIAFYLYNQDLDRMDAFAALHRENLLEVLSKKAAS